LIPDFHSGFFSGRLPPSAAPGVLLQSLPFGQRISASPPGAGHHLKEGFALSEAFLGFQ